MFQEVHLLEIGAILKRFVDLIQTKGGVQKYFPLACLDKQAGFMLFSLEPKTEKGIFKAAWKVKRFFILQI